MADPTPPLPNPSLNPSITVNRSQAEQAIYMELDGDTRFPAVSVTTFSYPDNTQAYIPSDKKLGSIPSYTPPITATVIFPKFATLNYITNSEDFLPGQGGFTSLTTAQTAYGSFGGLQIVTATVFDGLTATGSTVNALTGTSINPTLLYGPFTGVAVRSGIVMALNV
jgi:hypothetical protein